MKDVLGYEFFTLEDGAPLELDPAYGEKYAQHYNRKVAKLAWEVAQLLKTAGGRQRRRSEQRWQTRIATAEQAAVYLAECSYDRKEAQGDHRRGAEDAMAIPVLPDQPLPRMRRNTSRPWSACLARCALVDPSRG